MAAKRHYSRADRDEYNKGYRRGEAEGMHKESSRNPLHVHSLDKQYPMGDSMHGEYEGFQGRRRQEMEDAGMIREDRSAIANLPQNVMIKPYPKTGPYNPEILDDSIKAVDEQMDADDKGRAKIFAPHKY